MKFKNDLVLRAARGEYTERTPVWVMRQAGRILSEYRETRKKAGSFIQLVQNPELACEVTIQPVDILGVDAAILFSDILVVPEAMGLPYKMDEGRGPWFDKTIQNEKDFLQLSEKGVEEHLQYVAETVRLVKKELNGRVPLIGFAGAPWTILCYMVEGSGSKTFSKARAFLIREPDLAHALLRSIATSTITYLKMQIKNGCDMVQLFDSWAGILDKHFYNTFALPYIQHICEAISDEVPVTVFAKDAWYSLDDMQSLSCHTIGLDWHVEPVMARNIFGSKKTLQGNLDPAILYGDHDVIRQHTRKMLADFGPQRHIANLGHGVYPDINPENLKCFIDTIQEYQHQ